MQLVSFLWHLINVMGATLQLGSRVYLKNAVAGEPGVVCSFEHGKAVIEWPDMLEAGRTKHDPESLVVDEAFKVEQLSLDYGELVA